MAIVIHHFTQHSVGHRVAFSSAAIAVELFLCLSGFVLAHSYHEKLVNGMPLAIYAKKRLVRLYPMYIIGLVLGFLALILLKAKELTDLSWTGIAYSAILNIFYLPYFNSNEVQIFVDRIPGATFHLNNPAWSLFFGLFANLIYAATIRISNKLPLVFVLVSGAGLYYAAARLGEAPGWSTENFLGGFPRICFSFFSGVLIFQLKDKIQSFSRFNPIYLLLVIVLVLAVPKFEGHKAFWFVGAVVLMPLSVFYSSKCVVEIDSVWHRVCEYLGNISYPVYCVHFPLLMAASVFFSSGENYILLIVSLIFASVATAHLLMTYVESPIRRFITRRVVKD